jgi:hypothetical protein
VTVTKPAPSSGVKVSYAEWGGLFKIHGVRLVSRFGTPSVLDQFEYLGGGDCDLDYVEVSATLFDGKGKIVSTGLWNSDTVPEKVRLPIEVASIDEVPAKRAEIVVTGATCA